MAQPAIELMPEAAQPEGADGGHAGSSASDGMSEYDESDLEQEAAAARDGEGAPGAGGAGASPPDRPPSLAHQDSCCCCSGALRRPHVSHTFPGARECMRCAVRAGVHAWLGSGATARARWEDASAVTLVETRLRHLRAALSDGGGC